MMRLVDGMVTSDTRFYLFFWVGVNFSVGARKSEGRIADAPRFMA